jgi:hypothetical protein
MAKAQARGLTVNLADGFIAAVAAVSGMRVATRDTQLFVAMGLSVINPWKD